MSKSILKVADDVEMSVRRQTKLHPKHIHNLMDTVVNGCYENVGTGNFSDARVYSKLPPQQPDDFLATHQTLGRLLSPIFSTSVFTIIMLLFLS